MGNASSQSSPSSSSTVTCARRRGGPLDPRNQLENVYERLIAQNEQVKEQFRKAFQSVRILVVGRSGSGKSTLIRLLRYPDPALPLVIHDSNGIDVAGNQRIADIKKFLDARLATGVEFAEQVHAVWYVFKAIDNRMCDDGGLLELLCGYGSKELPLLLIMTHNDMAEKLGDRIYREDLRLRKRLSQMMVKVGNEINFDRDTGEILKQGSIRDVKGMEMVFERTKQLMHKELWITWVACQAVDMNAKLEESANLIVRCRKHQCWASSALATIPVAHQLQLTAMFGSVTRGLSKIWNIQQEFEKAITYHFLVVERLHAVTRNLVTNTLGALALASALAATVLTAGIAAPSVLVAALGSAWSQVGSTSTLLMSYALMVIGSILYDDHLKLCEEFVVSKWAQTVSGFSERYTSIWETSFREKRQRDRLRCEIRCLNAGDLLSREIHLPKRNKDFSIDHSLGVWPKLTAQRSLQIFQSVSPLMAFQSLAEQPTASPNNACC
ncbi:hypothetical protein KP509_1Z026400 [Ceratopteris richardii]|nr:hypothetical protein KP509_1Z026400 [Ceratopteris richardii]